MYKYYVSIKNKNKNKTKANKTTQSEVCLTPQTLLLPLKHRLVTLFAKGQKENVLCLAGSGISVVTPQPCHNSAEAATAMRKQTDLDVFQ